MYQINIVVEFGENKRLKKLASIKIMVKRLKEVDKQSK